MRNCGVLLALVSYLCLFVSCITDVVIENGSDNYVEDDFTKESVPFRVAISSDNDDWAQSSQNKEGEISNLKIIFFKETNDDAVVTGIEEVHPTYQGNIYEGTYQFGIDYDTPDFVVAVANYWGDCSFLSFQELLNTVTATPVSSDGYILMSSAVSFNDDKATCITSRLRSDNFKRENPEPIELCLERGVAKVTLGENEESYHPIVNWIYKDKKVYVSTLITGWGISATDSETYLVKNLEGKSKEDVESEINPGGDKNFDWYEEGVLSGRRYGRIHWAHSVNWEKTNYPVSGEEKEDNDLYFLKFEEIKNSLFESEANPGSIYVTETTRKSDVFGKQNAHPKLVVSARHSLSVSENSVTGESAEGLMGENQTFYLRRVADDQCEVMLEEDYWQWIADNQRAILKRSNERPDVNDMRKIIEERIVAETGWNLVRPAIKEDAEISDFITSEGEEIKETDIASLNEILYQSCGVVEKFLEGKALYSAPVVHFPECLNEENSSTGAYGLVRNNHYLININSISGPGIGIPADDVIVGDLTQSLIELGFSVSRIPWTEINQEAEFGK